MARRPSSYARPSVASPPRRHIHATKTRTPLQGLLEAFFCFLQPSSWTDSRQPRNQNERVVTSAEAILENSVRRSLWILQRVKRLGKVASNAIGCENERVPLLYRKHGSLQGRHPGSDHASSKEKRLLRISIFCVGTHQKSLNV